MPDVVCAEGSDETGKDDERLEVSRAEPGGRAGLCVDSGDTQLAELIPLGGGDGRTPDSETEIKTGEVDELMVRASTSEVVSSVIS